MADEANQVAPHHDAGQVQGVRRTIWQRLGFKQVRCTAFVDDDDPMFAPGYMLLETACVFDWKDRLRILVSGKVMISQSIRTDNHVIARKTASVVGVLPPDYEVVADKTGMVRFTDDGVKPSAISRVFRSWRHTFTKHSKRLPRSNGSVP